MPTTAARVHFVIIMLNKSRFLAFSALGCLPVLVMAQTAVPTVVAGGANGPNAADIYWLQFPAVITTSLYPPSTTPVAITASAGSATFKADLTATVVNAGGYTPGVSASSRGYLGPLVVPTWGSAAFGTNGNYTLPSSPNPSVPFGIPANNGDQNKFAGTSSVAFKNLKLVGPDGRNWAFKFVAADGESTDQVGESFEGSVTGSTWAPLGTGALVPTPTPPAVVQALSGQISAAKDTFSYDGKNRALASAAILTSQSPSAVTITLGLGTNSHSPTNTGSNTATAQAMAIGVWSLAPKVTVNCPTVTPTAASQSCTVTVENPPLQGFNIQLQASGNVDPLSSCLQTMSFAPGQTPPVQQSCQMKIAPTATTSVTNLAVAPSSPDNGGLTGWTTVNGTVNLAPPPKANADTATTAQDTPLTIKPADLLGNDSNPNGDTLTITSVQGLDPSQGTVALVNGNIVFTPAAGYHGTAPFTYTISDGRGNTSTATVTVTVTPAPNQPPVAVDHAYSTPKDTPLPLTSAQLLDQSTDPDGDTLTVTSVQDPVNGTVQMTGGTVTFSPPVGFVGTASFTYTVSDGKGGTSTKTVTITVGTAAPAAATPVPVGGSGMLALITALMAGVAGWSLRNRRTR